ncbi:glyoxalase [uncultured Lutibacter sp.]|uniref:glyoxalase n=1 Tax=uncultured Lutibacter sp. TaxID=437739 RepID=UPI0026372F7F|nr:glyoxalase [uncultured Lutibacter sp.]
MKTRPVIPNALILDKTKDIEKFQNESLRPIIKSLNDLIVVYFQNYAKSKKIEFINLTEDQKNKFIATAFLKDQNLTSEVKGFVIGQFSVAEFNFYKIFSKEINKRILGIVKQRILKAF